MLYKKLPVHPVNIMAKPWQTGNNMNLPKFTAADPSPHWYSCIIPRLHPGCFVFVFQEAPINDLSNHAMRCVSSHFDDMMNIPITVEKSAREMSAKYARIFTAYADVHRGINHGNQIDEEGLVHIGRWYIFCKQVFYIACSCKNMPDKSFRVHTAKYVHITSYSDILKYLLNKGTLVVGVSTW